jgi:hypothetical protein
MNMSDQSQKIMFECSMKFPAEFLVTLKADQVSALMNGIAQCLKAIQQRQEDSSLVSVAPARASAANAEGEGR